MRLGEDQRLPGKDGHHEEAVARDSGLEEIDESIIDGIEELGARQEA